MSAWIMLVLDWVVWFGRPRGSGQTRRHCCCVYVCCLVLLCLIFHSVQQSVPWYVRQFVASAMTANNRYVDSQCSCTTAVVLAQVRHGGELRQQWPRYVVFRFFACGVAKRTPQHTLPTTDTASFLSHTHRQSPTCFHLQLPFLVPIARNCVPRAGR